MSVLGNKYLTCIEAKYLLDKANYQNKTLKEFKDDLMNYRIQNKSQIQNSNYFAIGKEKDEKGFLLNLGCYCSGERKRK